MTDSPTVKEDTVTPETVEKPAEPTVATADPAPAKDEPASMLEAVQAAVKPKAESPPAEPTGEAPPEGEAPDETKDEESDELSAEEKAKLSERTQRRIKKLDKTVKERESEIGSLKPRAEEYDKIERFVRETGLTNDVVAGTLQIAALIRQNPREALTRLTPIVEQLQSMVGETLPPELAQRVQQGFLTEQDARAIARSSADAAFNHRRAEEANARLQADNAAREQRQVVDSTITSVETWEAKKAGTDPDWSWKRDEIAEQVELAILKESHRRGQPWFPTSQEAVKLSEDALKSVNDRLKRFTPRPRSIETVTSGGASTRTAPEPKSMLDVVRQTVGA